MRKRIISQKWMEQIESDILQNKPINITTEFKICIQWLIIKLTSQNIPYKLTNLGAGVSNITTENVDACPCCKRKF